MNKSFTILLVALVAFSSVSCGTYMKTAGGSFATYANGKTLRMTIPGGSLEMEDYDHASSILAAGQAVKTGLEPVADIVKTSLWTKLWGLVSNNTADTTVALDNNKTGLAKHKITTEGALQGQAQHNSAGLSAQGGGAEVTPVTIK
jgi:hypothetical protein